jgi:hypothetical protein
MVMQNASRNTGVLSVDRSGILHMAAYTVADGVVRLDTHYGFAEGASRDDAQGEAMRLFNRLLDQWERKVNTPSTVPQPGCDALHQGVV